MSKKNLSLKHFVFNYYNTMVKETQAIKDWKKCIKRAKKNLGIPTDSFVMVKGKLLKEAQKCYCSIGY